LPATRPAILTSSTTDAGARPSARNGGSAPATVSAATLKDLIIDILDDAKAEQPVTIDLAGRSPMADYMVIASGRSDRHVGAVAEQLRTKLKQRGIDGIRLEGLPHCDWVLVDAGDVIVHVFRPEVRSFYNLERMWSAAAPGDPVPA
jgi:ribosome-associated protein